MQVCIRRHDRSFRALVRSLDAGSAWAETRNVPTCSVVVAAIIMEATAAMLCRVRSAPVYHLRITFRAIDRVDAGTQVRVADAVLQGLRLQDREAVVIGSGSGTELHLVVNRVHPETGAMWFKPGDWRCLTVILRAQAESLGLLGGSQTAGSGAFRSGARF
jgi:hypothetical protein